MSDWSQSCRVRWDEIVLAGAALVILVSLLLA
jgi:hypothetical protein